MNIFKELFGIEGSQIKRTCIVMPLGQKELIRKFKINNFKRGKLYGAGSSPELSLIYTGMGPAFVGDALLYLKETSCRNVILFGSCGLVSSRKGLSIGSLVSPSLAYASESFSKMLLERKIGEEVFYPNKDLLGSFLKVSAKLPIREVTCATIPSLKLEEELLASFIEKDIDVVDMECSSFFAASRYCGFKSMALFCVSDIIKEKPFYEDFDLNTKLKLSSAIKNAAGLLCEFIQKNRNG